MHILYALQVFIMANTSQDWCKDPAHHERKQCLRVLALQLLLVQSRTAACTIKKLKRSLNLLRVRSNKENTVMLANDPIQLERWQLRQDKAEVEAPDVSPGLLLEVQSSERFSSSRSAPELMIGMLKVTHESSKQQI